MSTILCHYFFGTRLLQQGRIVTHPDAYLLGLQGNSVFFYGLLRHPNLSPEMQDFLNWVTVPDYRLQDRFSEDFLPQETEFTQSYRQGLRDSSYLEKEVAPFLWYSVAMLHRLHPEAAEEDCRHQIESNLDIILLRYETGKLPTEFRMKTAVPPQADGYSSIAAWYGAAYTADTGKVLSADAIAALYAEGVKAMHRLEDRTTLKRQFLKYREKKQKQTFGSSSLIRGLSEEETYDYSNCCENEWQWPLDGGEVRTDSYFTLYETALKKVTL